MRFILYLAVISSLLSVAMSKGDKKPKCEKMSAKMEGSFNSSSSEFSCLTLSVKAPTLIKCSGLVEDGDDMERDDMESDDMDDGDADDDDVCYMTGKGKGGKGKPKKGKKPKGKCMDDAENESEDSMSENESEGPGPKVGPRVYRKKGTGNDKDENKDENKGDKGKGKGKGCNYCKNFLVKKSKVTVKGQHDGDFHCSWGPVNARVLP